MSKWWTFSPLSRSWGFCLDIFMPSLNIFLFLSELLPSSLMELRSACTSHWRSRSFCRCCLLEMTSLLHPAQLVLLPPDLSRGTPPRTPVCAALPAGRLAPCLWPDIFSRGHPVLLAGWVFSRQNTQATQATPHLSCFQSQCQNLIRSPGLPYLNYTQLGLKT